MKLQTQIPLQKAEKRIDYSSQLLLLGSCFAENIGSKLAHYQFQQLQNPFGILFHPLAITNLILNAIEGREYSEKEIFFHKERWHSFEAHSSLSAPSKEKVLLQLNKGIVKTKAQLQNATHIVISLGTAWIYRHLQSNSTVVNCHKVAQSAFVKELLTVTEITNSLEQLIEAVKKVNPKAVVLFTISPVRHLKDGFIENQRSKAHLIAAVHEVTKNANAFYFPAYEIMMDELRDYRFYETDMIHPNSLAIDYIWQKFREHWISEDGYPIMDQVHTVQNGLDHKAFNEASEEHQAFLKSLEAKITYLKKAYPFMSFEIKG